MAKGKKDVMIVGRTGNNRQLHGRFIKGVVHVNGKNVILSKFFFALQTFFLDDGVRLLPLYLRWITRIQIAHIRVRFNIIYTCHKGIIQWHHYTAQCTFEKFNNSFVKSVCLWCVKTSATQTLRGKGWSSRVFPAVQPPEDKTPSHQTVTKHSDVYN